MNHLFGFLLLSDSNLKILFTGLKALIYGAAFVGLWAWMALGFRAYDNYFPVLPEWSGILGIVLISAGGILALLCLGLFVIRGKGTGAPFDPPREFVAVGPYRRVRNPMYIAGWLMFIGFGFYEHSIVILLFSLVFLLVAHLFVTLVEEPGLEKRFGQSYLEYKKSVNRWIPK